MRQLTKQQKKYLDEVFNSNTTIYDVDQLSPEQWQTLEDMNDTEILWQEANRYLSDKYFEHTLRS